MARYATEVLDRATAGFSQTRRREATGFHPPTGLGSPHLQTLCAALPFWAIAPAGERVLFPLPDGAALVAKVRWSVAAARQCATVLLIHGVGGSSESPYVLRSAAALERHGYHVVRLNLRGAGEGVEHATSIYHAGMTEDIDRVVRLLGRDPRVASLFVIGFSLGGSLLLKLAGEWGSAAPGVVRSLATLSAPTDFMAVSDELERLATLPYRRFILAGVIRQALAFARRHPSRASYDARQLRCAPTIREYDRQVMVPMHGFSDVRHYYESASAAPWLHKIRIPTLIVHAEDDPIIPGRTVAPTLGRASSSVEVAWTTRGGHVGWFDGVSEKDWVTTWAMRQVLRFFDDGRSQ